MIHSSFHSTQESNLDECQAPKQRAGEGLKGLSTSEGKLERDPLKVALGTFCADDYEKFSVEMDCLMKKRQISGYELGNISAGYESDLERERTEPKSEISKGKENVSQEEQKFTVKGKMVGMGMFSLMLLE